MKKLNIYHTLGLLSISIFLFTNLFEFIPHVFKGILFGIGLGLSLIGVYAYNHDISKLRNWKVKLIKSLISK